MSEEIKEELKQETIQEEIQPEIVVEETPKEESLENKIASLEQQLKESEDKYLRVHADFENIKKRLEREKYQAIDYASEKFAKDLLTPIDTLEMALASANADIDASELLRKLKAAKYVHEHPGEVCPAKWKEGEKTLAPSLDLVGKI